MTQPRLSMAIFLLAVTMTIYWQFQGGDWPVRTQSEKIEQERKDLIHTYLFFSTPGGDKRGLTPILEEYRKERGSDPEIAVPLALLFSIEGSGDDARAILDQIDSQPSAQLLAYGLGLRDSEPPGWETSIPADWAGAKIALLAYERSGRHEQATEMLLSLRHYENEARQLLNIYTGLFALKVLGMGVLISMFFTSRRFRAAGQQYFKLLPILIRFENLSRFCALILLATAATAALSGPLALLMPPWLANVIGYLVLVAIGLGLIDKQVLASREIGTMNLLGLRPLQIRIVTFLKILAGFAILEALFEGSNLLMNLLHWPLDPLVSSSADQELLEQPLSGSLMLILACIVAPCFEEVVFRGIIFRGLLAHTKPWLAIIASALLFAVVHPMPNWPLVFSLGVGLALIYYRTADLAIVIWVHGLWNLKILLLTFFGIGM